MAKNRRTRRRSPPAARKTGAQIRATKASDGAEVVSAIRQKRADAGVVNWREHDRKVDQALAILGSDMGVLFTMDVASLTIALQNGRPLLEALVDCVEGKGPTPHALTGREGKALADIQRVVDSFMEMMLIRIVSRLQGGMPVAEALEAQAIEVTEITEEGREEKRRAAQRRENANG